jgi:hypothetical protein
MEKLSFEILNYYTPEKIIETENKSNELNHNISFTKETQNIEIISQKSRHKIFISPCPMITKEIKCSYSYRKKILIYPVMMTKLFKITKKEEVELPPMIVNTMSTEIKTRKIIQPHRETVKRVMVPISTITKLQKIVKIFLRRIKSNKINYGNISIANITNIVTDKQKIYFLKNILQIKIKNDYRNYYFYDFFTKMKNISKMNSEYDYKILIDSANVFDKRNFNKNNFYNFESNSKSLVSTTAKKSKVSYDLNYFYINGMIPLLDKQSYNYKKYYFDNLVEITNLIEKPKNNFREIKKEELSIVKQEEIGIYHENKKIPEKYTEEECTIKRDFQSFDFMSKIDSELLNIRVKII